jgi:hypothetical protein
VTSQRSYKLLIYDPPAVAEYEKGRRRRRRRLLAKVDRKAIPTQMALWRSSSEFHFVASCSSTVSSAHTPIMYVHPDLLVEKPSSSSSRKTTFKESRRRRRRTAFVAFFAEVSRQ